jgi:hypothetical protein
MGLMAIFYLKNNGISIEKYDGQPAGQAHALGADGHILSQE